MFWKSRLLGVASLRLRSAVVTHHSAGWLTTSQRSLSNDSLRKDAVDIFNTAVESVLPSTMVHDNLQLQGNTLFVKGREFKVSRNVYVAAFGKAAAGMVRAVDDILGEHIVQGIASVPVGVQETLKHSKHSSMLLPEPSSRVMLYEGALNNIPDAAAHSTARMMHKMAASLTDTDILLTLITGGGSALLPHPIPPVTLEDMAVVTKLVGTQGATIQQLNLIRKNLELLKGGGLAEAARHSQVISLILSDIIGDPIDLIASAPTVADNSTPQQCIDLFRSLDIIDRLPDSVLDLLEKLSSSAKRNDCENAYNVVVGSNQIALAAASEKAEALGYLPYMMGYDIEGDAEDVGLMLSAIAEFFCLCVGNNKNIHSSTLVTNELDLVSKGVSRDKVKEIIKLATNSFNSNKPICILMGGETTVNVTGSGKGGRNQQMVLRAAIDMECRHTSVGLGEGFDVLLLSAGTDGQDGPTEAAGAMAHPFLVDTAEHQGLDASLYLKNNDAFTFFSNLDQGSHLVQTGWTGTNVMDIQLLIISRKNVQKITDFVNRKPERGLN